MEKVSLSKLHGHVELFCGCRSAEAGWIFPPILQIRKIQKDTKAFWIHTKIIWIAKDKRYQR